MKRLRNPYKDEVPVQRVTANVGIDVWNCIYAGGSMLHGFQDKFISSLIQRFYELTKHELPEHYDIQSEEQLASLLERLTLAPVGAVK